MERFNYSNEQQTVKESERFKSRRIVVKIGSSTIAGGTDTLNKSFIDNIAKQVGELYRAGVEVLIVSSGAVVAGRKGLEDTNSVLGKQVAALFGQPDLISEWVQALKYNGIAKVGQLLLTDNDLSSVKPLADIALPQGVIVANANDPVSDYEMKQFLISQDNDKLACFIAKAIGADTLLLLTDVDGVLDARGGVIRALGVEDEVAIFRSPEVGTGGISSKIQAGREFSGRALIANGNAHSVLLRVARGENVGTLLV